MSEQIDIEEYFKGETGELYGTIFADSPIRKRGSAYIFDTKEEAVANAKINVTLNKKAMIFKLVPVTYLE